METVVYTATEAVNQILPDGGAVSREITKGNRASTIIGTYAPNHSLTDRERGHRGRCPDERQVLY
jgi:hypothetical protein